MERLSWNCYFLEIAETVAKRSTCLRHKIGCVLVKDKRIIATGYNGNITKTAHCSERDGCLREKLNIPSGTNLHIDRAIHAEQNAIFQCAKEGISAKDSVLFSTHQPCSICTKSILQVGIKEVYYIHGYPDEFSLELFHESGVPIYQLKDKITNEFQRIFLKSS